MIAEPYIITKGPKSGTIYWVREGDECGDGEEWGQPYADFEREKLEELGATAVLVMNGHSANGFYVYIKAPDGQMCGGLCYYSNRVIGYSTEMYVADSESSRLLKRAEFLKAVCEKEGIEWLPEKPKCCPCPFEDFQRPDDFLLCRCPCHQTIEVCEYFSSEGRTRCSPPCKICKKASLPPDTPTEKPYSRQEMDERFKAILDFLEGSNHPARVKEIEELRKKYL